MTGQVSYHAGVAAEDAVEVHYVTAGYRTVAKRWRGAGGEIDLIMEGAEGFVFIEVKKSTSFARAAERLSQRQLERIYMAASEFLGDQPQGTLTPARIDVALVDAQGRIELIENAYMP